MMVSMSVLFGSKEYCVERIYLLSQNSSEYQIFFINNKHWSLYRNQSSMERRRVNLRQAITMTGGSSSNFLYGMRAIDEIFLLFMNKLPDGKLDIWTPAAFRNTLALDAHTHYFTNKKAAPNDTPCEFGYMVDPQGNLHRMLGDDFMHLADNKVEYFEIGEGHNGKLRSVSRKRNTAYKLT